MIIIITIYKQSRSFRLENPATDYALFSYTQLFFPISIIDVRDLVTSKSIYFIFRLFCIPEKLVSAYLECVKSHQGHEGAVFPGVAENPCHCNLFDLSQLRRREYFLIFIEESISRLFSSRLRPTCPHLAVV